MAYVDEGDGDAIVFAHGNPTSSYLWRNVMPHLEGLGRLVAADMIGMGGSDKLHPSGPDRYHYAEQRDYLFALWDALDLGDNVTLVLHDWGSVLGFDWANQHRDRIQGIAFMEASVTPISWSEFPPDLRGVFEGFRSPQGETNQPNSAASSARSRLSWSLLGTYSPSLSISSRRIRLCGTCCARPDIFLNDRDGGHSSAASIVGNVAQRRSS